MKSLFTSLILAAGLSCSAHAQNWSSAVNSGGANMQSTTGVEEQIDGSRIVVGTYKGNSLFGSYSLPWVTFSSDPYNSNLNSFIVKYKPNNTIEWATRICSGYVAHISSVSTDNSGNIYVCGMYSDVCTLYDSAHVSSPAGTLYNGVGAAGAARGFIAKYSKTGVLKWFRNGIGDYTANPECITDIKISEDGTTLVVTGRIFLPTGSTINVGGGVVSKGSYVLWLNPLTGNNYKAFNFTDDDVTSDPYSTGLCVDHNNNVIVSGRLNNSTYVVKGFTNTMSISSNNAGTATMYAKYNILRNVVWAKATNASLNNTTSAPSSIIVDDANNVYISGWINAHTTTNYNLLFPKASGYEAVEVVSTSPNHVFVVKLNSSTGLSMWKCYGRRSASGNEAVSLTKGPCDAIYVGINTAGVDPSFTDASLAVQFITSSEQANMLVCKINTNGLFQTTNPWAIYKTSSRSFISTNGNGKVHCAGSIAVPTTLTGVSGTFSPSGRDVLLASFTDNSAAPILSLNPTNSYCPSQNIPLNASSSAGTAPFNYTWEIWNSASSNYVSLGTNSTGLFNLIPSVYNPYIFSFYGFQVIVARVSVTNCSGLTSSEVRIIVINGNISYSQVNEVEVCYSPSVPAPDAVFSVNATNVGYYTWIYSSDNGINWDYCYNYPSSIFQNNQSATMTVLNPPPSLNGFLFACMMSGCNSVVSQPALLTVIPCTQVAPGDESPSRNKQAFAAGNESVIDLSMYPNPANDLVKFEVISTEQYPSEEWSIVVYDMTGRKIHQQLLKNGQCTIQTNEFMNGNYLCVLKRNQEIISNKKLIVAH